MTQPKSHRQGVEESDTSGTRDVPERYLSDREIAGRYDISEATLLRWRRQGKFPKAIRLVPGGPNRTSLDVILNHEAARRITSQDEEPPAQSIQPGHPYYGYAPRHKEQAPAATPGRLPMLEDA